MVCLRKCTACQLGDHQHCENVEKEKQNLDPEVFGGTMCTCPCNGRTEEQMRQDTLKWVKEQLAVEA